MARYRGSSIKMLLYAIIFISGGAILALELLASRIMTPYFGVSLYIWTGILSITLISLAAGYWAGGKLAGAGIEAIRPTRLTELFALMPSVASIWIVVACFAYPHTFSPLANWNLVIGAFLACFVLLFLPLFMTSFMNPLLVAILIQNDVGDRSPLKKGKNPESVRTTGDAGAGKVFFVSTLGSVAGVQVTAFALIPYFSNFAAVLIVAVTLAMLSLLLAVFPPYKLIRRRILALAGTAGVILPLLLLWQADAYTGRMGPISFNGAKWRVEAWRSSLFGTVKIIKTEPDPRTENLLRLYFHDGVIQDGFILNSEGSKGTSSYLFTYALEYFARRFRPDMKNALVLGLAAGAVPSRLTRQGVNVEVVEIDPSSVYLAQRFFGFNGARISVHQADARAFVRACPSRYDVAIVDLFYGDGTPEYLVTREFFRDVKRCLNENGVAVFNTFADLERPVSYAHLLVTVRSELPYLALYRPPSHLKGESINSFLVASASPLPPLANVAFDMPSLFGKMLQDMSAAPVELSPQLFEGGRIISDAYNPAALDFARTQLLLRLSTVKAIPGALLTN